MQYMVWQGKKEDYDLFSDENGETAFTPTLSHEQYLFALVSARKGKNKGRYIRLEHKTGEAP